MSVLPIFSILLLSTTLASKRILVTPKETSSHVEVTLYGDIVSVVDDRWEIATPTRTQWDEWDEYAFNTLETAAYRATQKGMHITVKVGNKFGFDPDAKSTVTIRIEGEVHADTAEDSEVILAFGNIAETQYFTSVVSLCEGSDISTIWCHDETTIYPQCGDSFVQGNVSQDADGEDFRWYTVGCPKNISIDGTTTAEHDYTGRYSNDLCEDIADFHNGFPIIARITNDPTNSKTEYMFMNHAENGVNSELCTFPSTFGAEDGFMFYMAGEGGTAAETFYISSIAVCDTTEDEDDLCTNFSSVVMEKVNGFMMMGCLFMTIYAIL